ncbi:MAG: DUF4893 domain-containing protein [Bacteroidaceae bacterium]|nr:DUF4893 domain-containing protein [Bacteroidaceae bacterium]
MKRLFLFILMSSLLTYCWAGDNKQKTIKVKSSEQFLKAINSDTRIIVEKDLLDLTEALQTLDTYNESGYNAAVSASKEYDGLSIHICNVKNLTIEGKKPDTHIQVTPRYADVLYFQSCENISLKNLKMGHTKTGDCIGNVVTLNDVNNIDINNCKLYGCGVIGIEATKTNNLFVQNSEIYDCSTFSLSFTETNNSTFTNCSIHDNDNGMIFFGCAGTTFNSCSFNDNRSSFCSNSSSENIIMNKCVINHSHEYNNRRITFNNCVTEFTGEEYYDDIEEDEEEEEDAFDDQLYPWDKTKGDITLKDMELVANTPFLSEADKNSLSNRYYSRAIAMFMKYRNNFNEKDAQTTLDLLTGEPVTLKSSELLTLKRVRSIQLTNYGIFIYNYFPCRIINDNSTLVFNKYSGSQRKWGYLYRQEDKLAAFTGCYYIEGNSPTYFNDEHFLEIGVMKKTKSGKFVLLILEDDKFELLEFIK